MMPAKSCHSCYFGGTRHGPECEVASTAVCCEEWIGEKTIHVRAVVEFEIDVRALEIAHQEEFADLKAICQAGDVTEEQYLLYHLNPEGIEIESITQIEQQPATGSIPVEPPVRQREVIVA